MGKFKAFLKRKNIEFSVQRYLIDAMSHMALGLFASLLVGTILNSLGTWLNIPFLSETVWPIAKSMMGPAIGVAVAYGLKAPPFVLFASAITGAAGDSLGGGPVGAFVAAVIGAEFGKAVSKETKVDLIVTPAVTILTGVLIGKFVGPGIAKFMTGLGQMIIYATTLQPFWMGILVSVLVGLALTAPISSAALCIMLGLEGLAAGAATAGCCTQMVGFAVISFKDNGWGGAIAQGIGTSMLQIPNIVKNYRILIPPTLASAITGPLATMVFKMENIPMGAGMGTSGLVGQFGTITAMAGKVPSLKLYLSILLLHFILPAVLSLLIALPMRKWGWIKDGDMKLNI
jgi:uncharacterized membrane protein